MSVKLDLDLSKTGTRFRLWPQPEWLKLFGEPETVFVSVPPAQMKPGPADDRMFVIDAINKTPYNLFFRPPYQGRARGPVQPGPDGHYDHIASESPDFLPATMYATVRRVLDIWEDYFGHGLAWHFESDFARLELIPRVEWDNAQSGYGFLEFGYGRRPGGGIDHARPYAVNFDVLSHELGHSIIFSEVGVPGDPADPAIDYGGFHESAGDLVAIVSVLHFDSFVTLLLDRTQGNLFTVNELDRVGELDASREIRVAFNYVRMSDVRDEEEPHARSLPLTGGIFDVMVEVFQKNLVARGLITQELADRSSQGPDGGHDLEAIARDFASAYRGNAAGFKEALLDARDYLGQLLVGTWSQLNPPNHLTYHDVLRAMFKADRSINGGEHQRTIRECFAWREIVLTPDSILLRPHTLRACGLDSASRVNGDRDAEAAAAHAVDRR